MVSKILGVDYGQKKIGIAIADFVLCIAVSRGTLRFESRAEALQYICALVSAENVEKIVMGLPKTFSGEDSSQTSATRVFAKELSEQSGVSVVFQDERLTSVEAMKRMALFPKRDRDIDGTSAQIILQTYLDTK